MASGKPSLRIDWFDGSVEHAKPTRYDPFSDETDLPSSSTGTRKPMEAENKPIGFKRLLEISLLEPDKMTLEVSYRPGFWNLLDQSELKGDYIVLIVQTLDSIYKTIRIDEGNSKMIKHLETRFLPSDFLTKLTTYLKLLPDVRIVEKRMNSHLWNDIEAFFLRVVSLCEGIIQFHIVKSKDLSARLDKLLKVLRMSAIGVAQNHLERIGEELFERISKIEKVLYVKKIIKPNPQQILTPTTTPSTEHLSNFKSLNIFPIQEDFMVHKAAESDCIKISDTINITPSLVDGAYPSIGHYLDIQFKLLREDYLGPLREGICQYLINPSKTRHENIRVHKEVKVFGACVRNNTVGYLVDLVWTERKNNSVKPKFYTKELMFGSLLLFTSDNFHTVLCATVLDSDPKLLKKGYIIVSFQNLVSNAVLSSTFLMVESEVFFEPYHQVLRVLQKSRLDKLPMQIYIVDVKPEIRPPGYLSPQAMYTIRALDQSKTVTFTVLRTNSWPEKHIGLDDSQLEAYKFALTREFAVIQGPPGTGKTFMGIKIAKTILENLSLKGTPMLIICFTNNALDQFLEGILRVTHQVIRMGSQSKSSKLEPYSLKNVKAKMQKNCKHPAFGKCRRELQMIHDEMTDLQSKIEVCETGILCYRDLLPYLNGKELRYGVQHWLFEHLDGSNRNKTYFEKDSWEYKAEQPREENINEDFTEKTAASHIENINTTIKQLTGIYDDVEKNRERTKVFRKEIDKIHRRLSYLKTQVTMNKQVNQVYRFNEPDNLYILTPEKRWHKYFNMARQARQDMLAKMDLLIERHKAVTLELDELTTQMDLEVVQTARVVGLTTTMAARRHQLIRKLKSNIMIVEEAAEVLEAHIIASLTFSLQHLILIGDHKQLRPSAANYRLAKECNLDVSLFERMIRNGIHARTLTTQRRMRPDFAHLLIPEIYTKLDNHPDVMKYSNVKGMKKNLFFMRHEVYENSENKDDSYSYENKFEAEWCVALARYLMKQGYTSDEITVLATYKAQVARIQKLSEKFEELKEVKITAVDNFQGEESRIVLLSLVRSNKDGKIGFLNASNRICVALSRAKEGFYIFGNMAMLSKASTLWKSINNKLIAKDAIGDEICTNTPVRTVAELNDLMETQQTGIMVHVQWCSTQVMVFVHQMFIIIIIIRTFILRIF